MSLEMSELEFALWLKCSLPYSQVVYHRGHLARDRAGKFVCEAETVPTVYSDAVEFVALAAWQAMENHEVHLTQRKLGKVGFEYLAKRTAK